MKGSPSALKRELRAEMTVATKIHLPSIVVRIHLLKRGTSATDYGIDAVIFPTAVRNSSGSGDS